MAETKVTDSNQKVSIIQKLDAIRPAQIPTIPEVADRFRHIYQVMNGGDTQMANIKFETEKFHFMKLIQDNPGLQQCTKLSLYGCFLDMAVNGLSFDPGMKHAYIMPFNVKVSAKGQPDVWEKRASLMISGQGELVMRMNQGQIKYADNPVLVYEGDHFKPSIKDNRISVEWEAKFPRQQPENIIACFLRIERIDGSVDFKILSLGEVLKFKEFSKDKGSLAWGAGLPGMIQTKTIKHAFRSYPKIRTGRFSEVISEKLPDQLPGSIPPPIDYGDEFNDQKPALEQHPVEDTEHEEVKNTAGDSSQGQQEQQPENKAVAPGPVEIPKDEAFMQPQNAGTGNAPITFEDEKF